MTVLPSTILLTGTTAGMVALLTFVLARAVRRCRLPGSVAPSVAVGMIVWLGAAAILARSGILSAWTASPPRWTLLPLTALGALTLFGRSSAFRRLLAEIPPWQPVALQAFRVGVELAFWRLHSEGAAPIQVTFEGQNFDAIVGLTALAVAAGIAFGRLGPKITIAWNLISLAMLGNAIGTVATSAPGPLHLAWPGEPFVAIASWPVVWIPALLAPIGIFLHVVSLRQAIAALGVTERENSDRRAGPAW